MPLEPSVVDIDDLNPVWPAPADPKSDGDDHIRELKKALLNDFAGFTGAICATGTDGGAANAYTVTPTTSQALPAYGLRMGVVFSPVAANTGACTLTIGALSAKPLRAVDGTDLVAGDLAAGAAYDAVYTGTEFRLRAPTKQYIDAVRAYASQLAFGTALPNQAGSAGKNITTDGAAASWDWSQKVRRSTRTANTALAQSDRGTLVDITSGTFTQTFTAAATLGDGWYVWLRNNGSGDITLDPNAAELIDGLTSYVMYPGEARLIQCDGTGFTSVVVRPFNKAFTSSGNFIKPPGYAVFEGLAWGGGASGGASNAASVLPAGASGAPCVPFSIPGASLSASTSVLVAASVSGVSALTSGITGNFSTFGPITAPGGNPGNAGGGSTGSGGTGSNGGATVDAGYGLAFSGASGAYQSPPNPGMPSGNTGSNSTYGGGGGGSAGSTAGAGGISILGGNGGAAGLNAAGSAGAAPGGGGGASYNSDTVSRPSGAGARGEVRIWGAV